VKISIIEFVEQIRKKEQVEGGKNGEKSHNEGNNVGKDTLLEICHFATVSCKWFSVASNTCNWKFAQLPKTSCIKIAVASDSPYMTSIYGWVIRFHPPILYISS